MSHRERSQGVATTEGADSSSTTRVPRPEDVERFERIMNSPAQDSESHKGGRRRRSQAAIEPPTENEPAGQPEKRTSLKSKLVATGIGAVAILGVAGYFGHNQLNDKQDKHTRVLNKLQASETGYIEGLKKQPFPISNRVITLHAGVKLRSTPDEYNSVHVPIFSKFWGDAKGNETIKVEDNQEISTKQAIWKVDKNGTWLGIRFSKDGVSNTDRQASSLTIAQEYNWFNYGALIDAKNSDGEPLVTSYPVQGTNPKKSTSTGYMKNDGAVYNALNVNPAGYGFEVPAGRTEDFRLLFGVVTPDVATPQPVKK